MRARVPVVAVLLAIALAATGCGGGGKKKATNSTKTTSTRFPPPAPVNNEKLSEGQGACGYVTSSDIQAAVGSPVNPGDGVKTKTSESCRWSLKAGNNQVVGVVLSSPGKAQFDSSRSALGAGAEALPGVGDQAFVAGDTAYALKGDKLLIVDVTTTQTVALRKAAATKLISTAIAHV